MSDTMLALVVADARPRVDPEAPLEDRFRAAMTAASQHFMVLDRDVQFRGAIGAVWESAAPDERVRIEATLDALRTLSALASGVPVDFDALAEQAEAAQEQEPLDLLTLWHDIAGD